MSKREFMVEVTITHPNGESLDDWSMIGKFIEDIHEDRIVPDTISIGKMMDRMVREWVLAHPDSPQEKPSQRDES